MEAMGSAGMHDEANRNYPVAVQFPFLWLGYFYFSGGRCCHQLLAFKYMVETGCIQLGSIIVSKLAMRCSDAEEQGGSKSKFHIEQIRCYKFLLAVQQEYWSCHVELAET